MFRVNTGDSGKKWFFIRGADDQMGMVVFDFTPLGKDGGSPVSGDVHNGTIAESVVSKANAHGALCGPGSSGFGGFEKTGCLITEFFFFEGSKLGKRVRHPDGVLGEGWE